MAVFRETLRSAGVEGPDEVDEDWDFAIDDELISTIVDCSDYRGASIRRPRGTRESGRWDLFPTTSE